MSPAQPPEVTICTASAGAPRLQAAMSHHTDLQAKQLLLHRALCKPQTQLFNSLNYLR